MGILGAKKCEIFFIVLYSVNNIFKFQDGVLSHLVHIEAENHCSAYWRFS